MSAHYISLLVAYATAAKLWFLANTLVYNGLWNKPINYGPKKAYLEFVFAIVAVVLILAIGQLYSNSMLIPNTDDSDIIDGINQFLIFSPTLGLVLLRKQSFESIWLPKTKIWQRILIGLAISIIALLAYWLTRKDAAHLTSIFSNIYHSKNFSHLVQVFMEDITIALIFVRLSKWIGLKWTIGLVALLFAAGHIPSMINDGYSVQEMSGLILDTLIGVVILSAVSKSKDVWWFFIVHFVLDMSQYYGGV